MKIKYRRMRMWTLRQGGLAEFSESVEEKVVAQIARGTLNKD